MQMELRNVWGPATKPGLVLPDPGVLLGHCKFTTGGRALFALVAKSQTSAAYRVSAAKNSTEQCRVSIPLCNVVEESLSCSGCCCVLMLSY